MDKSGKHGLACLPFLEKTFLLAGFTPYEISSLVRIEQ